MSRFFGRDTGSWNGAAGPSGVAHSVGPGCEIADAASAQTRKPRGDLRADCRAVAPACRWRAHRGYLTWQVTQVVIEQIGIGLIVALASTWLTTVLLRFAERRGWIANTGWRSRS